MLQNIILSLTIPLWFCNTSRVLNVKRDRCRNIWYICMHCKNSFGINSNDLSLVYKKDHHSVRNKGDLDSGMKTKSSNLALFRTVW